MSYLRYKETGIVFATRFGSVRKKDVYADMLVNHFALRDKSDDELNSGKYDGVIGFYINIPHIIFNKQGSDTKNSYLFVDLKFLSYNKMIMPTAIGTATMLIYLGWVSTYNKQLIKDEYEHYKNLINATRIEYCTDGDLILEQVHILDAQIFTDEVCDCEIYENACKSMRVAKDIIGQCSKEIQVFEKDVILYASRLVKTTNKLDRL